jgi:uncharacterized DUF497 family protein
VCYSAIDGSVRFIRWLAYWYLQSDSFEFEWDDGNSTKSLRKHGVPEVEVESVFELKQGVPIGRQVSPKVEEERLCVVGPTASGAFISVVFTLRDGRVRPISSRPASKKERRLYDEIRKALEAVR